MISRDALFQVLSRPLLISKRQQDTLALDAIVGDLNLMTSQDFDNYCVNGTFYLARGYPSSSSSRLAADFESSSRFCCPSHSHAPSFPVTTPAATTRAITTIITTAATSGCTI